MSVKKSQQTVCPRGIIIVKPSTILQITIPEVRLSTGKYRFSLLEIEFEVKKEDYKRGNFHYTKWWIKSLYGAKIPWVKKFTRYVSVTSNKSTCVSYINNFIRTQLKDQFKEIC